MDFREKILKEGVLKHRQTSIALPRVSRSLGPGGREGDRGRLYAQRVRNISAEIAGSLSYTK